MKVIGLCGAACAGKDTVASMMHGYRAIAFADKLREEVAEAYDCDIEELKNRAYKELPQMWLTGLDCENEAFCEYLEYAGVWQSDADVCKPCSPRQIMQWWGDWRASQDPDYFVKAARARMVWGEPHVFTDVRFANEAALVREMGGEIWQIVRPGVVAGGTGHKSDNDGSQFAPDRVIVNDGGLEDLQKCIAALL